MNRGGRRPTRTAAQKHSKVDFSRCDNSTLANLRKVYKLDNVSSVREDLVEAVNRAFATTAPQQADEDALAEFLQWLRESKQKGKVITPTPSQGSGKRVQRGGRK